MFKQFNKQSTIFNTCIPATQNGETVIYSNYINFKNNNYYTYLSENNMSGSYLPNNTNSYINIPLPKNVHN